MYPCCAVNDMLMCVCVCYECFDSEITTMGFLYQWTAGE